MSFEDNQIEEQLLNISIYTKNEVGNEDHCDEMLARCEEEVELLEELLRELDSREEVVENMARVWVRKT